MVVAGGSLVARSISWILGYISNIVSDIWETIVANWLMAITVVARVAYDSGS